MNPREIFFQSLEHFKQGEFDAAQNGCQKLLAINPNDVNGLRLSAQIHHQKGNLDLARKSFEKVLSLAPDYAHAQADLGKLLYQQQELNDAREHLQQALKLDKRLHSARRVLYDVLEGLGDEEAAAALAPQLQQREDIKASVEEALELYRQKQFDAMEARCQDILKADPGNLVVISLLADYTVSEHKAIRAEKLFRTILQRIPESHRAWNGLARAQIFQDRPAEALKSLQRSREINRNIGETQVLTANAYSKQYDYDKAIDILQQALAAQPEFTQAMSQLGFALKTIGQQQQAIEILRRCINTDESYGEAYWSLSDMKTFSFSDTEVGTMQTMLSSTTLSDKNRVYFGYALGKALEHRQQYSQAFEAYDSANRLQKKYVGYSAEKNRLETDELIECFTEDFYQQNRLTDDSGVTPIFVVSLPRSGSTLQEQILASHSQVEGTQELSYIPRLARSLHLGNQAMASLPFPRGLTELTRQQLQHIRDQYLQKAAFHRKQGLSYFIDKLPNNFFYAGLIALCFPNAKIINARRHPMDSCLGCFKQLWAMGQEFTYSQEDLARYYVDYDRLVKHWHQVMPGRILDVQYESVVEDLETNVRKVLDFCELPFEEDCLTFHKTERAVVTSSSEQVRKPIYRSALAYWKNFETELAPMREILGRLAD
jgi:tetratricopeptide (TPR) repeat protein